MKSPKFDLHDVVDSIPFSLIVLHLEKAGADRDIHAATIDTVNRATCRLLGYAGVELVGQPFALILADTQGRPLFSSSTLASLKEKGATAAREANLRKKNGEEIPVLLSFCLAGGNKEPREIVCLAQEDSERRSTQEELLKMYRAVEQSPSAVVITDTEGCIEYVNPKFSQMTGYAAEELVGKSPNVLQSGSTTPEQYQHLWQTLLAGQEWRGDIQNKKKNGELYWARESISAIRNARGEITHFLSVEEDITRSKQVEKALQESEERFRQMAEMTGEWLWEQDSEGYYVYSSAAVEKILGYRPEQVVGCHYTEFFTPEDRASLQEVTAVPEPFFALINHYCHRDGHIVYTESTGLPLKDAHGEVSRWRGVDRDITARKRFEDALKESEKRTRLIIENAMDAVIIMDEEGLITDWNPKAEALFGWQRNEAIGRPLDETIIPKRYRERHRRGLEGFLKSGEGKLINRLTEQTAVHREGHEFPVEVSISPLKIGERYIFSGFIRDITERKQAEKDIRDAQVKLAVAYNEMKIARQIQESLFPTDPLMLTDIEVMGYCLPAAQVGGDYFDYFRRERNCVDVVIADVSGHSVGPALFMVETRSTLRSQSRWTSSPAQILGLMNETLYEDLFHSDHFITMFYMQYDGARRELSYANAGHPPPMLLRGNDRFCSRLDSEGLVLGVRPQVDFEEKRLPLQRGDLILLYTDGITEAENPDGEFFGEERLCRLLNCNAELAPSALIRRIVEELQTFCQTATFGDDITLVIFKAH